MREIENISQALFDKIRTRFNDINLGDEKAQSTTDPEKARYFNFNYGDDTGSEIGGITISLIDETGLKIYYNKSVTDGLTSEQQQNWYQFLRSVREFAKRNLLSFDVRDIAKSNLDLKDIKQSSKSDSVYDVDDFKVTESRLYGSSPRRSFEDHGNCRIRVDHSENINLDSRGARGRKIDSVFLETQEGERFKLDFNNLHYARAMAQHVNRGGRPYDEIAESITGMAREMAAMGHFVRGVRRRQFEDTETLSMIESANAHYQELKERLHNLAHQKYYEEFVETFTPQNDIEDDVDIDSLRERFVKKVYNDKFDEALPYVYRAHKQQQSKIENAPMVDEFAQWADEVSEGTWAFPDTQKEVAQLDRLMQKPIQAGTGGENATGVLYDIIGDDQLFDDIAKEAETSGPDFDVRSMVISWLDEHGYPELSSRYKTEYQQPEAPEQPDMPNQTHGATAMDEPNVAESQDPLVFLKSLAGIR
jgi:hypothetical protein